MLVCDKRDRAITWDFCRGLPLTLMFLVFYKTICSKKDVVWRHVFSNKIIVTIVTQGLPSSFLFRLEREFTTINEGSAVKESAIKGSTSGDGKEKRGANLSFAFLLPITLRAPFGHASRVSFLACDSRILIDK